VAECGGGDTERLVWWTRSFGLGSGPSRDRLSPGSAERRWSKGHFSSGGGREHYKNPNAAGQVVWVDARDWGRIACPRRADLRREGVSGEISGSPLYFRDATVVSSRVGYQVTAHKVVKLKGASNDYAKSWTKGSSNGIGSIYRWDATSADWSCPRTTLRSRSRSRMAVRGRAIPLGSS